MSLDKPINSSNNFTGGNSPAQEYQAPKISNEAEIAEASTPKTTGENNRFERFMQHAVNAANVANIVANGTSALMHSSSTEQNKNNKFKNIFSKLVSFCTKASMGINSIFNIYDGHNKKELFNVLGYTAELAVSVFAPYKLIGFLRGIPFTLYQIPKFLTAISPGKDSTSYSDNLRSMLERMKPAINKIFSKETYKKPFENFPLLSGAWGAILSCAGVFSWALTGSTKLPGLIKGLGEVLIDSFQLAKNHWDCKRTNYIGSGLSFVVGSLCEIVSKQKDNDPVTMALYFVGSGIGRMFMTWSNMKNEQNYPVGGPAAALLKPPAPTLPL